METKIQDKYYEALQKIETEGLPFALPLPDFSFQEAEKLRYKLMEKKLRVEIYEEFKELHLGIYDKN